MNRRNFLAALPGAALLAAYVADSKAEAAQKADHYHAPGPDLSQGTVVRSLQLGHEITLNENTRQVELHAVGALAAPRTKTTMKAVHYVVRQWLELRENWCEETFLCRHTDALFTFEHSWTLNASARNFIAESGWTEGDDWFLSCRIIGKVPSNEPIAFAIGQRAVFPRQTGPGSYVLHIERHERTETVRVFAPLRDLGEGQNFSFTPQERSHPQEIWMPLWIA